MVMYVSMHPADKYHIVFFACSTVSTLSFSELEKEFKDTGKVMSVTNFTFSKSL